MSEGDDYFIITERSLEYIIALTGDIHSVIAFIVVLVFEDWGKKSVLPSIRDLSQEVIHLQLFLIIVYKLNRKRESRDRVVVLKLLSNDSIIKGEYHTN